MKKIRLFRILLILLLLINLALVAFYFFKLNPEMKLLKDKLNVAENKIQIKDCTRAYSQSQGKVIDVCKKTKSETLSDCSKNFRENLVGKTLNSLKSISDLEKFRELSIKMCMQEAGFDY